MRLERISWRNLAPTRSISASTARFWDRRLGRRWRRRRSGSASIQRWWCGAKAVEYTDPATKSVVRIEGHGEPNDTRDHALAMGARRAQEVRDYLVLLGVPAVQLGVTSFGKERPGAPRAVTILVR